jgi:hypothetical protein
VSLKVILIDKVEDIRMSIPGSIANLNKLKYMQYKQRLMQKQQKARPLYKFANKYYLKGYKFSYFADNLESNKVFSYVRYGESEMKCLFAGTPKAKNVDKHQYFPELKDELTKALLAPSSDQSYLFHLDITMFEGTRAKTYYPWIKEFILANKGLSIKFLPKDPLIRSFQSYPEIFRRFVAALNKKHVVIVGPKYLEDLEILTSVKHHIVIPDTDCYLDQERVQTEIEQYASDQSGLVFLFSASMMSNTLIDRLHPKFKGHHFLLDCGSIWDNFIPGRQSRPYMKKFRKKWERSYPNLINKR